MVKLTTAFVARKITNKTNKPTPIDKSILKKLTHLHLQDNYIDTIGDISQCKNLTVLYLQNNCLTKIDNLEWATHLTHLYLQRNKITKIENINGLRKLKKLYIGHNCIAVVEGLDKLCNLEELHIQKQKFPQGESLHFDPRTVKGLSRCLHILDVTDNGMTTIADLECLYELRSFIAQNNQLANISDITQTVSKWYRLTNLELQENPVCSQQKYKERIITSSNSLILLNGKKINDATRDFLRRLEVSKQGRLMAPHHIDTTPKLPVEITDLTKNFTPGVRKSITRSILQDAEVRAVLDNNNSNKPSKNPMFPAWKTCLEAESYSRPGALVPRPFWRQVNGGQAPQSRAKKSVENLHLPRL